MTEVPPDQDEIDEAQVILEVNPAPDLPYSPPPEESPSTNGTEE
jgi:hypothetical protein